MSRDVVKWVPEEGETGDMPDLSAAQVISDLGESEAVLPHIGEKPAHFPMRMWVKLACVLGVQNQLLRQGTPNVAEACRVLGWQRWTYENAIREPAVIEELERRLFTVYDHGMRLIEEAWPAVVQAQLHIAQNTEQGQASTRAASWLSEQMARHEDRTRTIVHAASQQEGGSRLAQIAERFGAQLVERTTTTKSVKVPPPSTGRDP